MEDAGVAGPWTVKDMVAHMAGWQARQNVRIQAAQRHEPAPVPPWPAELTNEDDINTWIYQANHGRPVRDVLDETDRVFQQFLAIIDSLPDEIAIEPAHHIFWLGDQRFSASEFFDHFHDDHEPDLRAWLARTRKPSRPKQEVIGAAHPSDPSAPRA